MTYTSYSNYLEYKHHKKTASSCNNTFSSYGKYNRSINSCRAWWTNDTLRNRIAISPCKALPAGLTTLVINYQGADPTPNSSIGKCCN